MQGPIAQIVALTSWGNARLRGAAAALPDDHIALQYCESVRFVDLGGEAPNWIETPWADDPHQWFAQLAREHVTSLHLWHHSPGAEQVGDTRVAERMLVGFVGGGGRWLIEARKGRHSDYWEGKWELGDRSRKDHKIWRVSYGRISAGAAQSEAPAESVEGLVAELGKCLAEIASFARSQEYYQFADAFDAGLAALSTPPDAETGLLLPPSAPAQARQLVAAVERAWVFGGMGSWNDIGFDGEDQRRYESLSEQLYQLLNRATLMAANA